MDIGSPKRFAEIARGGFEITSCLRSKNMNTSVEIDDNNDRTLSVKILINVMPAWGVNYQVNSKVGTVNGSNHEVIIPTSSGTQTISKPPGFVPKMNGSVNVNKKS